MRTATFGTLGMDQPPTRLAGEIFHHTDRRRVSRIRCYAPVLVESTAGCYPAALADLSLQGALLQVPQWQPAVNECATLLVELDTQGIQLILEARVRHQHDARIGVQFTEVNDLQQRCLRQFLFRGTGDQKQLPRTWRNLFGRGPIRQPPQ